MTVLLHAPSQAGDTEVVVFEWSTKWGSCYECGLPAAFWIPGMVNHTSDRRDENGVTPGEKRCAVCAANAAVDGEHIARIDPGWDS